VEFPRGIIKSCNANLYHVVCPMEFFYLEFFCFCQVFLKKLIFFKKFVSFFLYFKIFLCDGIKKIKYYFNIFLNKKIFYSRNFQYLYLFITIQKQPPYHMLNSIFIFLLLSRNFQRTKICFHSIGCCRQLISSFSFKRGI